MTDTVKTFRRPAYSWAQHLIELAVTVFLVGLLTNTVMYSVLLRNGLPRPARRLINNITTGVIASSVLLLNARRYSRCSESTVILTGEGLSIRDADGMRRVSFHDVALVSVAPEGLEAKCLLHLADATAGPEAAAERRANASNRAGAQPNVSAAVFAERAAARTGSDAIVGLPVDVASFSASRQALEATLVGQLADEFGRLLDSGATIHFREDRARAGKHMLQATVGFATGIVSACLLNGAVNGWTQCAQAVAHFRRGWRGRGVNFYVDREGVWLPPFTPWDHHSWQDLSAVRSDAAGILLAFSDGVRLSMSPFAEHYWPFAVWVERRFAANRPTADQEPSMQVHLPVWPA